MAENTDPKDRVDTERVSQMRELLATGGDAAVQARFGEDATKSKEFAAAKRQRDQVLARRERLRQQMLREQRDRDAQQREEREVARKREADQKESLDRERDERETDGHVDPSEKDSAKEKADDQQRDLSPREQRLAEARRNERSDDYDLSR